ncbi:MAG: metallophosphoesterase, partial [Pseudomonadota bacterium]|nr:metallophosphoesterase [Pseudomonadota bacterium]
YGQLKEALAGLPFPTWFCMGNHDSRAPFGESFPHIPTADGFVQYAIDDHPLRILVLDTLDVGRHSGAFCEVRAAWLADRLAEQPDRPTLLMLHHPPVATGLSWMTESPDAIWIGRLGAIVAANANIVGIIGGHLHRAIVTQWAGTMLVVCPSTAPQLALDLDAIDPDHPDDRPMIVEDLPGYAIHNWDGTRLFTHFDTAEEHKVLARYVPALQPLIQKLMEERSEN